MDMDGMVDPAKKSSRNIALFTDLRNVYDGDVNYLGHYRRHTLAAL